MKNNNNSRKYSKEWYSAFELEDTRYYGVFLRGPEEKQYILVDPKRYQKIFGMPEEMKKVMDKRKGPLFHPAKKTMLDYNVNVIRQDIAVINREWNSTQKPFIKRFLSEVKGTAYSHADDDLFQAGIVDINEAIDNARILTVLSDSYAEFKRHQLFYSLYAQYFHQFASQVDAMILRMLTRNGYGDGHGEDKFNRNVFYAFKSDTQEKVKNLDGFIEYDKMYAVWNFIKHNSLSTYKVVKDNFPEALKEGEYKQGELACFYVNFTDEFIDSILNGVEQFLKEYCHLVFDEDSQEAQWNSEEYFLNMVYGEINETQDPFGLRYRFY